MQTRKQGYGRNKVFILKQGKGNAGLGKLGLVAGNLGLGLRLVAGNLGLGLKLEAGNLGLGLVAGNQELRQAGARGADPEQNL